MVLVPFYRGAVVFRIKMEELLDSTKFSSPFIEERLYLKNIDESIENQVQFSSPFIEERLYLLKDTQHQKK